MNDMNFLCIQWLGVYTTMHDVIAENFQLLVACQENGIHFGDCVEKSNVQLQIPAWDSWYGAFLWVAFNNFRNVHVPMQCNIYLYYSDPFNFDVKIDNFSNTINNFFFRIIWYSSSMPCSGKWNGSFHSTSAILHQFWGNLKHWVILFSFLHNIFANREHQDKDINTACTPPFILCTILILFWISISFLYLW